MQTLCLELIDVKCMALSRNKPIAPLWFKSEIQLDILSHNTKFHFTTSLFVSGDAVAQLFEALHYMPEGRGFDSLWCYWNFFY